MSRGVITRAMTLKMCVRQVFFEIYLVVAWM